MTNVESKEDCVKECIDNSECSAYVIAMPTQDFPFCMLIKGKVSESDAIPYVPMSRKRDVNEEESICGIIRRLYEINQKGTFFFIFSKIH